MPLCGHSDAQSESAFHRAGDPRVAEGVRVRPSWHPAGWGEGSAELGWVLDL